MCGRWEHLATEDRLLHCTLIVKYQECWVEQVRIDILFFPAAVEVARA
jgi:hypothetical protein